MSKTKKPKRWQRVEVTWIDIVGEGGWHETRAAKRMKPMTCVTLGYFLEERNGVYRIASSKHQNRKQVGDVTVIPSGNVVKVTIE